MWLNRNLMLALIIWIALLLLFLKIRSEISTCWCWRRTNPADIYNVGEFNVFRNYQSLIDGAITDISSDFSAINCEILFSSETSESSYMLAQENAKRFSYRFDKERRILSAPLQDRCNILKRTFGFNEVPLSKEEKEFPLAYAALVYKWTDEVLYMLSALYHPQNLYCIAVDGNSGHSFMNSMLLLSECFANIHVMIVDKVDYCDYTVINPVVECLRRLSNSNHSWKYFQYLSNFDLPLRTNREMVRILKRLNGSFNSEIKEYQSNRLEKRESEAIPYGITLYKSSLSATFSRQSAEFIVNNEKAQSILRFLNGTSCPDESLWTTVAGNLALGMPKGFDASRWLKAINRNKANASDRSFPYYISRFQIWVQSKYERMCKGKFVHASCVYGVDDLRDLEKRPELIAHKFYLDYQPAAFFCFYKRVRERAIQNIELFDDAAYGQMPGPRVLRGEPIENVYIEPAY